MNAPLLPGAPLTPEQRRLLDELAARIDPDQARWLSGYFAGLAAGLAQGATEIASAPIGRKLLILYGTETGNSAALARALSAAAEARGLAPVLTDMADYKVRNLAEEEDILVLVSTYGEGDPPQPAVAFFEFVEGRKAPKLKEARFAVLALGDSSYERFCEAGKRLDRRLEALGAARLAPRLDCDIDYEDAAAAWIEKLVDMLAAETPKITLPEVIAAPKTAPLYDKRSPFLATVIENIAIVGRGSSKETRHIELSLEGSGLTYEPGDALAIAPANDPAVVSALLDALGWSADRSLSWKEKEATLGELLSEKLEITTATPRFVGFWAEASGAAALKRLNSDEHKGERSAFLRAHHIIDIVRRFPVTGLAAEAFVSALRPLQPRLYSIASSLAYAPNEAHLTVSPVRYVLHGEPRAGVASCQLVERSAPDARLPVYIQPNAHFRLPADDVPIIMIGAGTGVAPFRAFMQEREARGASGRSWLFFGERRFRTDFLYQSEWQSFLKEGVLTRMDVAFSRDGADKVYVQHRMREAGADLYAWLEEGAHLFVCGDAAHLAPDVNEALIEIIAEAARIDRDCAEDYVKRLAGDHRYQRDVY